MLWLLQESVLNAISAPMQLTADQVAHAREDDCDAGTPGNVLTRSGDSATISITGVMTSQRSFMAFYFGGGNTLYKDIAAAIDAVEMDPNVKSVDFAFNSGGGEAQPVLGIGDKIAAMTKPTRAVVTTAASAAYWLASQADTIVAVNRASQLGSIGVVIEMAKPSQSYGISVTSSNAPNKRPDPETDAGKAVIREWLDQSAELFSTAVAVGRDKSIETVNNTFGQGAMMLADQALAVGMIDAIGISAAPRTNTLPTTPGATTMDLATLQASHPALLAQVQEAARNEGAKTEQDRVKFHALMGQKTGATQFALDACLNGTPMNDVASAVEYATFGRNNADLSARAADEALIADNAPASTSDDDSARVSAGVSDIFKRLGA
jgi:ClpP class serine protease